ncbi:MAG: enoyl-CoA hydratase/isomerase family protein [Burkholderiales bacterium]|nr:enoyl-CoA hydratase/isomerase family protein [Burkholderiales bacterium]
MSEDVLIEAVSEGVIQIRLNRPERMNALGHEMSGRLAAALESVVAAGARVLLVRGTGKAFCAGADLKERLGMNAIERAAHNAAINAFVDGLASAPIPTIAVVNGAALGGGCEIALACDLRVIASGATIGLTEVRVGAIPGAGGTQRLPRVIGRALALELMMTGEPITGTRAAAIGLVNAALPLEELDARARSLATVIASRSPFGVRRIKRLVYEGLEMPEREAVKRERECLKQVLSSKDYAEGLAAFSERRPPQFTGE